MYRLNSRSPTLLDPWFWAGIRQFVSFWAEIRQMLSIFFCPLRLTEVEPHFLNHGEEDKHFEVTSSIDSNINLWHPNTTMTTGPLLLLFQSKQQPEFETHQAKASQPCLSQILVESTLDQRRYTSYATYLPIIIYIYIRRYDMCICMV